MTEMRFEFSSGSGVSGEFAYGRDPDGGGRLNVRFSSHKLRQTDGSPKSFSLDFNNIGKGDPLDFLESLDQGYLNDKLPALSARRDDLFQTIGMVRHLLDEGALEPEQIEAAEQAIDRSASHFYGDHRSACEGLIHALIHADLPGFQDDPFHLIGHRCTLESRIFERVVWPHLIEAIEDHICSSPELDRAIAAIVAGEPLPAPDQDDDWAEPDPGP